jgi:glycosyltransferase involved in cell wall biosynthesis
VLFEDGPFVQALGEIGAAVTVIPAPAAMLSVKKESRFAGTLASVPALLPFIRHLAKEFAPAEVIYLNSQKALVAGAPAGFLARKRVIWNLHDILTAEHFGSLNRRVAVSIANRFVDRVVVNSAATSDALRESGFRGTKIDTVYNGIDGAKFRPVDDAHRAEGLRKLGLPQQPVVGLFGRISRWKGQDVLVRALAELPTVTALVVGGPLFQDDEAYLAEVRQLATRLGVESRIIFAGSRPDVASLMPLCDVVAHTSTLPEPFGRVIVEAMSCGVPVVATNAGGAAEIVKHGSTGLLVEPGQPAELATAIRDVIVNAEAAAARAHRARREAAERYSIDQMVEGVKRAIALALQT